MDRNLTMALLFAPLAVVWGYSLSLRLREGYLQLLHRKVSRKDEPGAYWTFVAGLLALEFVFVGFAIRYLVAWL